MQHAVNISCGMPRGQNHMPGHQFLPSNPDSLHLSSPNQQVRHPAIKTHLAPEPLYCPPDVSYHPRQFIRPYMRMRVNQNILCGTVIN